MKDNNKFRLDVWGVITILLLLVYLLFLVYPLLSLLEQSVYDSATGTFTLSNFKTFFSKSYYFKTLGNSFKVSFAATLAALIIGVPMAYFFTMFRIRGQKILNTFIIISSMSAPFIGAYSWILLCGNNGVVTNMLSALGIRMPTIYGFGGIVLVLSLQLFSLVFLYVRGALKNIDNSLLEASRNLGTGGIKRFFKIVLPLCMPTILAASLMVFMRAFADFGTPLLIGQGYTTFPVILYQEYFNEVNPDAGFASAIAVISIFITTAVFLVQKYVANRKSFSINAMHSVEKREAKGVFGVLIHLFCYVVVFLAMLPQFYVFYISFKNTSGKIFVDGYSLMSYEQVFEQLWVPIRNTLVMPIVALAILVVMAVLMSYLVVRRRNRLTNTVDILSMIPYVIPGTVLGIAMLGSFNQKPLLLTGTFSIMVIALIIRRLPYTVRSSVATLQHIPMSIEEAAISLGCTKLKAFFKVTVPMMKAGILSGAILSWVTMISELSSAIMLRRNNTKTLTIAVYEQIVRGSYGKAAALASILTILTIISITIYQVATKGQEDMTL